MARKLTDYSEINDWKKQTKKQNKMHGPVTSIKHVGSEQICHLIWSFETPGAPALPIVAKRHTHSSLIQLFKLWIKLQGIYNQ